jgi:hypothetical protein
LCWYHHQLVDTQGITMHWTGITTTGAAVPGALLETGWAFTDATGHRITLPEPIEAPPPATDPPTDPPPAEAA